MAVKISELPNLAVGNLTTYSSIVPLVANTGSDDTTFSTSMANIKTYMETGGFDVIGNLTTTGDAVITGNLSCDVLTANTQVVGNVTTVSSTANFVDIQTDANVTYPVSDNGLDVGIRQFWYKTSANSSALVWRNSDQRLVWYGANVGNSATLISANSILGEFVTGNLFANSTTNSTSSTTGALIVKGGAGIAGNAYIGSQLVITGNTSGSNLSLTGLASVTGTITAQGNITTPARMSTGNLNVNTFVTIGTTLATGGTATVNALAVNTTANITGNINGSGITLTSSGVVDKSFQANGGLQNTPIGNATASSATFTTVNTGDVLVTGNVDPSLDATYDLGNLTYRWANIYASGTVTANATFALYADLAEMYVPDQYYDPGTVVVFGGEQEITATDQQGDTRVAGAISTQPAYVMNEAQENGIALALRGKVPVKVVGSVNKGDLLITSNVAGYATAAKFYQPDPNAVFAKSLERDDGTEPRVIWAVIL
jgi:cytoskeletal protein CcmA (bactofilin family)